MALNHEIGVQVPGPVPPARLKQTAASMREYREAEGEIIDNWGTWGGVATALHHGDRAEVCTLGCDPSWRGVRVPSITPSF